MGSPTLIFNHFDRSSEHIALRSFGASDALDVALLAPEDPFCRDNGRFVLEWLIGESTAEDVRLRGLVMREIEKMVLGSDDPCPWFALVSQRWHDSEITIKSSFQWIVRCPLPLAPSREQWDFSKIADADVIACCLWEYGRESHTLGMVAADRWVRCREIRHKREYAENPALRDWHDKEQARIEEWLSEVGFDLDAFSDSYWRTDFPLIEIYDALSTWGGPSASAWHHLSEDQRQTLVRQVGESCVLKPMDVATVGELEELWEANNARLLEIRSENRPEDDNSEDCELCFPTVPTLVPPEDPSKRAESVTVALTVDYSRFTDREIVKAFTKWVKDNRPTDWQVPRRVFPNAPQRGRKLVDYRVALERLGLMRLLNDNYPDELRWGYPDIWKRMCRDGTHFRRECQLACDFFRSLFPFLPEDELPRCAKPVEVWEPEIEAEIAREKEGGASAGGKSDSI